MSALDWAVVALYALVVSSVGLRAALRHGSSQDLLLAGRSMAGWTVLLSMLATELSAATFLGVPQVAYTGNWSYLQLALGALLAKSLLAIQVIPRYHAWRLTTVYGFLARRFGPQTHRAAALCFVLGRVLASGARLFIAGVALASLVGVSLEWVIVVTALLATLYTLAGGVRSVMWTDALQAGVFLVSAAALALLLTGEAGGPGVIHEWAQRADRTRIWQTEPWLSSGAQLALGNAVLGGFFLTLATHATDHDMVQRLLTARTGRSGGRALLGSALLNFPVTLLFLGIGTALAYHYAGTSPELRPPSERALTAFALERMPAGLLGLFAVGLVAAAMSSLDSAIGAIAATWVSDVSPREDETQLPRRIRRVSGAAAVALTAAALAAGRYHARVAGDAGGSLIDLALSSMTILYGGLLGIFAVGLVSERTGSDLRALCALAVGGCCGLLLFLQPIWLGEIAIGWVWWIPIGAGASVITLVGGRPAPPRPARSGFASPGV